MEEMERKFPRSREQSLFASVELSLRRMSPANREKARVLGVFHGGVDLEMLRVMMAWEMSDVASLAAELVDTGLATPDPYTHFTLNPALCPYLRGQMDTAARESLTVRWVDAMHQYADFLNRQQFGTTEIASTLTLLELPNLFALLERLERAKDAEATIALATSLYSLLRNLGSTRLLERVAQAREAAAAALGETWNHARFEAERTRIQQQLGGGRFREAFDGAQELLRRARVVGETRYPEAHYDLAMACWLMGRVLKTVGGSEQALPLLDEAQQRFEAFALEQPGRGAEEMAPVCLMERSGCLLALGRLEEAASAYEETIRRAVQRGNERDVAVGKGQLGTVRFYQRRYDEALEAHQEARERFTRLEEPGSVAVSWHQTGMVYEDAGQPEAAEDAYRKSLALEVRLGNVTGQASTLGQLGLLYDYALGRTEEAVTLLRQALTRYVEIRDVAGEGRQRNNLALCLRKLRRFEEAREEIRRAIECKAQFGHASTPWTSWNVLANIENDAGNPAAAREAKRKGIEYYLAYRRDGGENHYPDGRIGLTVTEALLEGDPAAAASFLGQIAANPALPEPLRPFLQALQAIVAGSRDRSLADSADMDYTEAAEILFLLETLEQHEAASAGA
ncbi:MAG TPA: tetratricopeptide repeat protein [Thermoanaerobaculia bacterium]|nr:tetratricopeptide repeat protein [Thermoanaerobaculia bacterium]